MLLLRITESEISALTTMVEVRLTKESYWLTVMGILLGY